MLWSQWVWHSLIISCNWNVGTYTLNGLLIGGSSRLHTMPWNLRTTSSTSESSVSWTPIFQHRRLAPISIGLQSSLMLLVLFFSVLVSVAWMIDSSLYWPLKGCAVACYIASSCFGCWSIPLVGWLDWIEYYECFFLMSLTSIFKIVVFVHEGFWAGWL